TLQLEIELYPKPLLPTDIKIPQPDFDKAYRDIKNGHVPQLNVEVILKGVLIGALAVVIIIGIASGAAELAGAITASFAALA
ncbi:peptidoglycan-binding protein, partial [Enterococcus faecalis]